MKKPPSFLVQDWIISPQSTGKKSTRPSQTLQRWNILEILGLPDKCCSMPVIKSWLVKRKQKHGMLKRYISARETILVLEDQSFFKTEVCQLLRQIGAGSPIPRANRRFQVWLNSNRIQAAWKLKSHLQKTIDHFMQCEKKFYCFAKNLRLFLGFWPSSQG